MSVKPAIATARPVYALRSEITTGMSAPPMGITSATPNTRASKAMAAMSSIGVIAESTGGVPPGIEAAMRKTERSTTAAAMPPVTNC